MEPPSKNKIAKKIYDKMRDLFETGKAEFFKTYNKREFLDSSFFTFFALQVLGINQIKMNKNDFEEFKKCDMLVYFEKEDAWIYGFPLIHKTYIIVDDTLKDLEFYTYLNHYSEYYKNSM